VQMNNVTPDIAMVLLGNVSLMLEYAAQIWKSTEDIWLF
jgi:hypothetical protein